MKCISWNVNGLRAVVQKGFCDFFKKTNADIFCLQETKMQNGQLKLDMKGYNEYWNSAIKKGYSGTAVFIKDTIKVLDVSYGIGIEEHDQEGRVITVELENYYIVNTYVPNSQRKLERLEYRMLWEIDFRKYLKKLDNKKPVIMCGDLNTAHEEIDLANPKANHKNAGFTDAERNKMTELLNKNNFIDVYRYLYPDKKDVYTWWSYMFHARDKNIGWRIDYFIISERLKNNIKDIKIYNNVLGSDHCPIGLEIK
ncbi:MAG: exodeoxyribonuclease III [Clostridia bacterium]|nr:exodeoxyribonuclease III [Clostridia bacterium]